MEFPQLKASMDDLARHLAGQDDLAGLEKLEAVIDEIIAAVESIKVPPSVFTNADQTQ
ncbi:MAG: hypothetical protein RIB80_04775 [Rhodospirillales bacterium]